MRSAILEGIIGSLCVDSFLQHRLEVRSCASRTSLAPTFHCFAAAEASGGSSTKKGESVTHVSTDYVAKQLPFFSLQSDELK